jgi:HD superfamily phosphohydrolase
MPYHPDTPHNRIRDVLYKDIMLSDRELKIVQSPDFQRLNYVLQLPTVYKVYPSATHTRFSHSLGVLQVATLISKEIGLPEEDLKALRIACLLHDISELPFERIFEEYLRFDKEDEIRKDLIRKLCDLINYDWQKIWNILDGQRAEKAHFRRLYQILYSDVGANRIDYLRRDSFYSGVSYGFIDERIYSSFVLDEDNDEILIKWTSLPVVESLYTGVYQLKHSVYDHKMVPSSLSLLRNAVSAYLDENSKDYKGLLLNEDSANKWLLKTDEQVLKKLRERFPENIRDYENDRLPRGLYELDFYRLKKEYRDPDIMRWFESLRAKASPIEKEITERIRKDVISSSEILFDVVSVVSPSKGPRSPKVLVGYNKKEGLRTPLWEVSRMIVPWFEYFSEQWKLYLFCRNESNELRELCKGMLGFLNAKEKNYLPSPSYELPSFAELYEIAGRKLKDAETLGVTEEKISTFRDKILKLSPERKEVLTLVGDLKEATATQIAELRGKKRETSNILLRKLENDGLVMRTRKENKVYYVSRSEVDAVLKQLRGWSVEENTDNPKA